MSASPFRVLGLNASQTPIAEITTVRSLITTDRLSKTGEASLVFPAGDLSAETLSEIVYFDLYDEQDGYLGRYILADPLVNESQGIGLTTCHCFDLLDELTTGAHVGFRRKYSYHPVDQVVAELAALGGWQAEVEANIGSTTITFEGDSVLQAIDELRSRWQRNFRLQKSSLRVLEFGAFGEDSGVRCTNLPGQVQALYFGRSDVAIVGDVQRHEDRNPIVNSLIALGAGQGLAQITMRGATAGSSPLLTGANQDGSLYYYIEDAVSVARYGRRWRTFVNTSMTPADNTDAAKLNIANAVKLWAENLLAIYKDPVVTYDFNVVNLPASVQVGDTIRLSYRGVRDDVLYLNVDETLYVLEVSRTRSAEGARTATMLVSNHLREKTSDQQVMQQTVRDFQRTTLYPQTAPFVSISTSQDSMQGYNVPTIDFYKEAHFSADIDNSVTQVNKVSLHILTFPMWSPITFGNPSASGKTDAYFTALKSPNYPQNLRLRINGDDVTAQLGGPWNTGQEAQITQTDLELDITDFILAASTLYQRHTIEVFDSSALVGYSPGLYDSGIAGYISNGIVQCTVRIFGTTQAIASES